MVHSLPIKSLPPIKRPRERLLTTGVANLSTTELLAVIVGSGTRHHSALALAESVHKNFGDQLSALTMESLKKHLGVVNSCKVMAALELGKRTFTKSALPTIIKPPDVLREVDSIRDSHREHTVGLYLNARYELLKKITLTIGSVNATMIEPRDVFAPALALPCRCLILIHNHPSGDVTPSEDDVATTKRLQQAGELLGINILDHLIVSGTQYFSFHHHQLLATFD